MSSRYERMEDHSVSYPSGHTGTTLQGKPVDAQNIPLANQAADLESPQALPAAANVAYGSVQAGATTKEKGLYSRRNKPCCGGFLSKTACIALSTFCCLIVLAGITVGLVFGIAAAECAHPKFNKNFALAATPDGITALSVQTVKTPLRVTVKPTQEAGNFTATATLHAVKDHILNEVTLTLERAADGHTLVLKSTGERFWSLFDCYWMEITVGVPERATNSTLDLNINDPNGYVEIESFSGSAVEFGNVDLQTANGAIKVNTIRAQKLTMDSSNGEVQVKGNPIVNEAVMDTSNGAVRGDLTVLDSLAAKTSNGKIDFSAIRLQDGNVEPQINLLTSNGKLEATLSNKFKGTFALTTSNGKIDLNGPGISTTTNENENKQGTLNGGGKGHLQGSTSNGKIAVTIASV